MKKKKTRKSSMQDIYVYLYIYITNMLIEYRTSVCGLFMNGNTSFKNKNWLFIMSPPLRQYYYTKFMV